MKTRGLFILGLFVALPILVAVFGRLAPRPAELSTALVQSITAQAHADPAAISSDLRQVAEYYPDDLDLWERIGDSELANKNFPGAVQALTKAAAANRLTLNGWFDLASAYQGLGDLTSALSTWRKIADRSDLVDSQFEQLMGYFRQYGDWDGATHTAEQWHAAARYDPQVDLILGKLLSYQDSAVAVEVLSEVGFRDDESEKSALALIQAIQSGLDSNNPAYLCVLVGQSLSDQNEWAMAEQAFSKATSLDPGYAEAWALFGEARQVNGGDGYPALQKALSLSPNPMWYGLLLPCIIVRSTSRTRP